MINNHPVQQKQSGFHGTLSYIVLPETTTCNWTYIFSIHLSVWSIVIYLASYPGLPYFSMLRAEKSGRPGRLCDVMMTCGHYLGRGWLNPAYSPTHTYTYIRFAFARYYFKRNIAGVFVNVYPCISGLLRVFYQWIFKSRGDQCYLQILAATMYKLPTRTTCSWPWLYYKLILALF